MTILTDERILDLWAPRLDSEVQRPILGKNKIIAFARAIEAELSKQEPVARTEDESAAVEFYRLNPSAALFDFRSRIAKPPLPAAPDTVQVKSDG